MLDTLRQATLSEILLLFVLLFVVPMLGLLIQRLRKYEMLYGALPGGRGAGERKKKEKAPPEPKAVSGERAGSASDSSYPYAARAFLTQPERACLRALAEALGPEVEVFPKVALWEYVEPTDADPGYRDRLKGLALDFLVCDRSTGQPLTAVLFKAGRGRPAGPVDETAKICKAAGAPAVLLELADEYDAASLKRELGIPDLDI